MAEKQNSKKDFEVEYKRAVEILREILCVSSNECESDHDIYDFLKGNNELPDDYVPYWE